MKFKILDLKDIINMEKYIKKNINYKILNFYSLFKHVSKTNNYKQVLLVNLKDTVY